jgi:hypothetical protein
MTVRYAVRHRGVYGGRQVLNRLVCGSTISKWIQSCLHCFLIA